MASRSRAQYSDHLEQDNHDYGERESDQHPSKPVQACQSCRASKVRCIQLVESQPCVRCDKAGRQCLPTENPNKKHKRYDGRSIAELEAALAALTNPLHHQSRDGPGRNRESTALRTTTITPQSTNAAIRITRNPSRTLQPSNNINMNDMSPPSLTHTTSSHPISSEHSSPQIKTMISDLINDDIACSVFEVFTTNMLPEFPFLAFPSSTNARDVWKSTPILFLAILDVAADGFCELETSRKLRKLLVQVYGNCLLGTSSSSLPLLQALIISAVWHRAIEPAQPGEQLDVYQISHAAANMAIIMGLGKSLKSQTWSGPMPTKARKLRGPTSEYQTLSLETRRIWLSCHYICSNTSMALQTPNIMRWTQSMDECLEVLEMSPASLPSDKALCLHIRLQRIVEDFEFQVSSSITGLTAAVVTHRAFRRQLATWASSPCIWNDPLRFSQLFITLYMHEIAMCSAPDTGHFQGAGTSENAANIDPAEFADCLAAAHGLLDVFLSLDMSLIRALPTIYFVRLTYAAIVLVKLHFAAARLPDPECAAQKTLELKVDHYLGRMLQKFSGWGTLWPAWRLTKGLRKLRELFRQSSNRDMMANEVAWLNLWTFKESSSLDESVGGMSATSADQIFDTGFDTLLAQQSMDSTGIPTPVAQMLPLSGGYDQAWDLLNTDASNTLLYNAMDDTLPSMNLGGTSSFWATDELDQWFDTNVNTSTFDFDGDLQSTIQYINWRGPLA